MIQNPENQKKLESLKEEKRVTCLLSGSDAFTQYQIQYKNELLNFQKSMTFTECANNIIEVEGKG